MKMLLKPLTELAITLLNAVKTTQLIAEDLIVPCIKDVVHCIFSQDYVRKTNTMLLSNNTVSQRIQNMSDNIEDSNTKI